MTAIAALIFAAIVLSGLLNIYLDRRQAAAVLAHRGSVPAAFASTVTLEEHQRAADYTVARALSFETTKSAFNRLVFAYLYSGHLFHLPSHKHY